MGSCVNKNDYNDNNDHDYNNNNSNIGKNSLKRGLLIGINYIGKRGELNGCINDSENLKNFLVEHEYFNDDDFVMMNDHQEKENDLYPTKNNIFKQMNELVKFANEHSNEEVHLFLSYSGHGYHIVDVNNDEDDAKDEVLCPIDYDTSGYIVDDDIKLQLIDRLPENTKIFILIDSCHSGTVCDLKYNYLIDRRLSYKTYDRFYDTKCDVVMISGCRDNQTSADAYIYDGKDFRYEYQGAMSASFIKCFNDNISYKELIEKMRTWLSKNKFDQVPQLSSGKYIKITDVCLLCDY